MSIKCQNNQKRLDAISENAMSQTWTRNANRSAGSSINGIQVGELTLSCILIGLASVGTVESYAKSGGGEI